MECPFASDNGRRTSWVTIVFKTVMQGLALPALASEERTRITEDRRIF